MNNIEQITERKSNLVKIEEHVSTKIEKLTEDRGLTFPVGYNPQNALATAMLEIKQNDKLMNCNNISIAECLLNMIVLGLDAGSNQCYLVPYRNQLKLTPSYFGTQTILRRIDGIKDIVAQPIYEGDEFDYDVQEGKIINVKHKTKFGNRKNDVIGSYAVISLDENIFGRNTHTEVMDIEEIHKAWGQGATRGGSPAHQNFPQEMAKKTVINRACKNFINTLTDDKGIVTAYNTVVSENYDMEKQVINQENQRVIKQDFIEPDFKEVDFNNVDFNDVDFNDVVFEEPNSEEFKGDIANMSSQELTAAIDQASTEKDFEFNGN